MNPTWASFLFAIILTVTSHASFLISFPECLQPRAHSHTLQQATHQIHTWSQRPFDRHKPTLIYVAGGPGETPHRYHMDLPDWNTLFFDARGSGCSTLKDSSLDSYKRWIHSQGIAQDMEEIKKHFQLKSWVVVASSYGTIPATIYSHLYPEGLDLLVLEGTIFSGGAPLIQSLRLRQLAEHYFKNLSSAEQTQVLSLSHHPKIDPHWFTALVLSTSYLDQPAPALRHILDYIFSESEQNSGTLFT